MKETDLWQRVKALKFDFAEREEPGGVNLGLPDMLLVSGGVVRFVENKIIHFSEKGVVMSQAAIRDTQIRWHYNFQKASPNSYFLLGVSRDEIYLLSGAKAIDLKAHKLHIGDLTEIYPWTLSNFIKAAEKINKEIGR